MTKHALWLVALVGCALPDRELTGPTIQLQLTNNDVDIVDDGDPSPSFELATDDTQYSIAIQVLTRGGSETDGATVTSSQVTSVTTTLALGGMALPPPMLVVDPSGLEGRFMTATPVVIPASAMGMTLAVHAAATDDNGVGSNVIDLQIALR